LADWKIVRETAEKLLTIVKSSIRSALLRRSSRDHNPSLVSLSLYSNVFRSLNILVNWTRSNKTLSLTKCELQAAVLSSSLF